MFALRWLGAGAIALTLAMGASAQAAPIACGGTFYLNPSNPTPVTGISWSITPTADSAGYYCGNPNPQNASTIADYIKTWFSLSDTPTFVSGDDDLSGGTLNYTDNDGFNAVGIHIGQGEFAFIFAEAITNFVFNVGTNNLSNVRAYCTLADGCTPDENPNPAPGPVPLPGAVFLMGSVLAGGFGAGALRRRRNRKAAA
jgi:hypothetical protein